MHAPTRISYGEVPSGCRLNLPKLLISFGILAHDVPLHPLDPTAGTRRATNTVSAITRPLITFGYARVPQDREPRCGQAEAEVAVRSPCSPKRGGRCSA